MKPFLIQRSQTGAACTEAVANLPAYAGASLGLSLTRSAKGFLFNARQNVQRPCVQRLGGGPRIVMHSFPLGFASSSLNEANHGANAECLRETTENLRNLESSK